MRARRTKSRRTPHFANVIEHLESRCLLSGTGDLVGDTSLMASDLGILTATQPLEVFGTIDDASDRDVFQFQAGTHDTVTIALSDLTTDFRFLDTAITLLDSSGNQIAFDDDSGPGTDSRLVFLAEAGETYFLGLRGVNFTVGDYSLRLALFPEVGDRLATARDLGLLTSAQSLSIQGVVDQAFDRDVFRFEADVSGSTRVDLAGNFDALNTFVTVLDSTGQVIASNDNRTSFFTTNSQLTFLAEGGETYFVEARGIGSTFGAYQLSLTLVPDVGDTLATARDLGLLTAAQSLGISSAIDQAFDRDVFQFQTDISGSTRVSLSADFSGSLNTFVTVLDSSGTVIASNDNRFFFDTNSLLTFVVEGSETYFVEARGVGSSVGAYQLSLSLVSEVGDTLVTARDLGLLTATQSLQISSTIDQAFDHDVFRFEADVPGSTRVSLSAFFGGLDTFVTVLDSAGQVIASNDNFDPFTSDSFLTFTAEGGATYFVEARCVGPTVGDYFLSLTLVPEVGDTLATARDLGHLAGTQSLDVSSAIDQAFDRDVFRFEADVPGSTRVSLSAFFGGLDTFVTVLDSAGQVIASNDNFDSFTSDSFLTFMAEGGATYFVEARGVGSTVGDYFLSLTLVPEVGDTLATARDLGHLTGRQSLDVSSVIDQAFDRDVFRFEADVSGSTRVFLGANFGQLDTFVTVLDSAGQVIASNDNFDSFTSDSFLTFAAERGATYFVEARGVGSTAGDYLLSLTLVPEVGDTLATARDLGLLAATQPLDVSSTIDQAFDRDIFRFEADVAGTTRVNLSENFGSFGDLDTFVTVLDSAGQVIASNDNSRSFSTDSFLTFIAEAGTTYFVEARGVGSTVGDYSLSLTLISEVGDALATAQDLGLLKPSQSRGISSVIDQGLDRDVFRFEAGASGPTRVSLSSSGGTVNTLVTVFDSSGTEIASNDNRGSFTTDSLLTFVAVGNETYFVEARSVGSTVGEYFLSLNLIPDVGDTLATARDLGRLTATQSLGVSSAIDQAFDRDVFSFESDFSGATRVSLSADFGSTVDTFVNVLDSSGTVIASNDNRDSLTTNSALTFEIAGGETYFVEARGVGSTAGGYFLSLSLTPDIGDTLATARDLGRLTATQSLGFSSVIDQASDRDVFRFEAGFSGSARVNLSADFGSTVDTLVNVLDSLGTVIASNDNRDSSTTNSAVTFAVAGGETYFVEARSVSSTVGAYRLTLVSEIGDTLATARDLGFLTATQTLFVSSVIDQAFDRDVVSFQADASGTTRVELGRNFDNTLNAFVRVLDSSGQEIAANDNRDAFTRDSFLTFLTEEGETYFVEASGVGSTVGGYFLSLALIPEVGDTLATARDLGLLTGTQSLGDSSVIDQATDRDVFQFQADVAGLVFVDLNASFRSSLDTIVAVLDVSGNVIASNDNFSNFTTDSQLRFAVAAGETYFVDARGADSTVGEYFLSLNLIPDVGDTLSTARDLGLLTATQPLGDSSFIDQASDRDVFQFQADVTGSTRVTLSANFDSDLDSLVTVLDSSGVVIASNDNFDNFTTNSQLTFAVARGETYFVEARGAGSTVGEYFLSLNLIPEIGDTLATAFDLGLLTDTQPLEVSSAIDQAFDRDVFQFQADVSGFTRVSLSADFGSTVDTLVTVLDSFGNVIASNDDSDISTTDSSLAFVTERGEDYFVVIRGVGTTVGEYQLRLTLVTNLGVLTTAQPIVVRDVIDPAFDRDRFQFQTSVSGLTVVELRADFSFLNTFVTVFDSSGNAIASNDDIFFSTDTQVTFAAEAGETYFVEARGFSFSVGEYSLRLSLIQDVVGGTIATALDLGRLTAEQPLNFVSLIDQAFDRDVFQFQADRSGSVLVELSADFSVLANLPLDTIVTVFDSAGHVIATNNNIELFTTNSRLVFTAEAGETYFVEARGFSSSIGGYFLHIAVDMGFPPETATNLGSLRPARSIVTTGMIEADEFHDLFLFRAITTGTVEVRQTAARVAAGGVPFDGILQAFNVNSGVPIATDFGSFDTTVPRVVEFAVVAGQSYFAEVTGFGGSIGAYQVTFNYIVDDVPAAGVDFVFPSQTGLIERSGDIDTYRFTADADQTLQISLDAAAQSSLDPILNVRVFASDDLTAPQSIFRNDDFRFSVSVNSFLSVPVFQGQVVEVDAQGFNSSRGRYNLRITSANGNGEVTPLFADTPAFGNIETAFSTDVFRFMATSPGMATIDVTSVDVIGLSLGAIGDPLVTIRETVTGNFVAFDDDNGLRLNSLATFFVTAGTQYDVVVRGFDSRTGNYLVTLRTNAGDDGNTFGQAAPLSLVNNSLTMPRHGSISPPPANGPADVDVFSFMASSNGTLLVRVTPSGLDLQAGLSVFQASPTGNTADVELLDVSGASASGTSTELLVPVSQGRTYFFRVSGLNSSVGDYSLSVENRVDQVPGEAPGATLLFVGNTGTPANLSDQSVNFASDRDWYRLVATTIGEFTINLAQAPGSRLDPILSIYNDQGLAIVRNDDSLNDNGVSSLNSQLTLQTSRANEVFFVEAAGINETTGDYRLTVQFAAQAADDFGNDVGHISLIPEGSPGLFAQQGLLEVTHDRDFFAFTAEVGGTVTVQLDTSGSPLPPGVALQVFEVEASQFSNVSIDNLAQVASIVTQGGETALNLTNILNQGTPDDVERSSRHFVVAVSHVGETLNLPVSYSLSINVELGKAIEDLSLENAALFALLSLADGAAAMGDQNSIAINAAIQAAMNELGKSGSFLVVLLDPVNDPVLTDSSGRQTGFMSNSGTLNGVPGGYVSVGSFGQVLIVPINLSERGSVSLQFAGVESLGQALSSFSAFVVGPSGSEAVSLSQSSSSTNNGGKGIFVVALGFGTDREPPPPPIPSPPQPPPIPNPNSQLMATDSSTSRPDLGSSSSFIRFVSLLLGNRPTSRTGRASTGVVAQSGIEDSTNLRFEDELRQSIDRQTDEAPGIDWPSLLDGVLERLQFDGNSRQSIRRLAEDLQGSRANIPLQFIRNSSVGRSAKAMYDTLKVGAVAFGTGNPKLPVPKVRPLVPKTTPVSPAPRR